MVAALLTSEGRLAFGLTDLRFAAAGFMVMELDMCCS